ncbi:polyketide synthase A [Aspergillus brunneoviolaceus CBS 621.78]|uniref:Polyketide synthase A n=1 Tax=Aspergillus brunneoviolaceus CBS 621.78 TaxID=1450534 RepID=A0ACD1G5S2_9EURO|nr:polyketide synthase A [Aspergillus brunneoviolaceus CBS 621.78]RAH44575.1 polyketide synthase A [Aspergillus brunneoviolaceus CBS 621.78]
MKEPIAIVGSSCRFPGGVTSAAELWELLYNPRDVLTDFPSHKLNLSGFYHPNPDHLGCTNVPNRAYLLHTDHRHFDAAFFGISPAEAECMDPQQRVLLETTYEALEAAGYTLQQMQGSSTAVFVGVMTSDYHDIQMRDLDSAGRWNATGTAPSLLSNRLSYFFDLKGPSITVNTACSSSLVALHYAVQSLRNQEAEQAIVAGVNLILDAGTYVSESKLHMLSPTSRCRMWDEAADGYARGEGCASVILKPLNHAIADGDNIECIVRETLINSDGRSPGITMPSVEAQASLIRQTYLNTGLDPVRDRCQLFECHGTGTPAGDPVEAQAIQTVFFPKDSPFNAADKLHVGSIKTLVGHLEGCAGLAGLLKAVECIKNRMITANLLFDKLNPRIEPFYDHLEVPTQNLRWPSLVPNSPLRASVNSFGFGGTNAHAIIESYTPLTELCQQRGDELERANRDLLVGPFVFSAHTRFSLMQKLQLTANYVRSHPSTDLNDLAWVLGCKRTLLPLRRSFSADSRDELLGMIERTVKMEESDLEDDFNRSARKSPKKKSAILGIFTGQGAQWAAMGRDLIQSCPIFRDSIEKCQRALEGLPDGPSWSLQNELTADEPFSRVAEAELSQPLTTAIEIAICDLLSAAGIQLDVVVGHSSGEIAATYAAGILSAEDAIRIAYYRGYHARQASSRCSSRPGAMMAVSLSYTEATQFCTQPLFRGRIVVAASNSPTSVTLSGDRDAIFEAKVQLDNRNTFSRILRVDVAYHSHHMRACADAYLTSLKACNIRGRSPREGCNWTSSVKENEISLDTDMSALSGEYWVDNMVQPVLFSQALEISFQRNSLPDLCIEVGPHPALNAPVMETIKKVTDKETPYVSMLRRAVADVKAASLAVGLVWELLGPHRVDLGGYRRSFELRKPKLLSGLPSYCWDHRRKHWRESRMSRNYRLQGPDSQQSMGRRTYDCLSRETHWRNILRLEEMKWLQDYKYHGEPLLCAGLLISRALEAARSFVNHSPVSLVEIRDLELSMPLKLERHDSEIECVSKIRVSSGVSKSYSESVVNLDFACDASTDCDANLQRFCTARVILHLGKPHTDELPEQSPRQPCLTQVDPDVLYELLEHRGLVCEGPFRAIKTLRRTLNHASVCACWPKDTTSPSSLLVAAFETAFQSLITAFNSPFVRTNSLFHLPSRINRLAINQDLAHRVLCDDIDLNIDAFIISSDPCKIEGEFSIFDCHGNSIAQADGVLLKSTGEHRSLCQKNLFSRIVWEGDPFTCSGLIDEHQPNDEEETLAISTERIALFYAQRSLSEIDPREVATFKAHHRLLYNELDQAVRAVKKDTQSTLLKNEWFGDSDTIVKSLTERFSGRAEVNMLQSAGSHLASFLRGHKTPNLGHDHLNRFFLEGLAFRSTHKQLCDTVKRIVHKHPHMHILELGGGIRPMSMASKTVGDACASYCYTCNSQELVDAARSACNDCTDKISFKVADLKADLIQQGFSHANYDLVITTLLHLATPDITPSLQEIRRLLKPGGYLVLTEITGQMVMSLLICVGMFPEWWHGNEPRQVSWKGVSPMEIDRHLRAAEFSGIDTVTHDVPNGTASYLSVVVSQAVNTTMDMLREPIRFMDRLPLPQKVMLAGGKTWAGSRLIQGLTRDFAQCGVAVGLMEDIDDFDPVTIEDGLPVISAIEVEKTLSFSEVTHRKLLSVHRLFERSRSVLWLSSASYSGPSFHSITLGLGRVVMSQHPDARLQFLAVTEPGALSPNVVLEAFLRLLWSRLPQFAGKKMLWTHEPEIRFDGRSYSIPRLVRDEKRDIEHRKQLLKLTEDVYPNQVPVELHLTSKETKTTITIKTRYSIPLLSQGSKRLFMWLGATQDKNTTVMGIGEHNSSVLRVRPDEVYVLDKRDEITPAALQAISSFLVADLIASALQHPGPVLIYEPNAILAATIQTSPRWRRREVYFVTSTKQDQVRSRWIGLHPQATRRMIQQALPTGISYLVNLATGWSGTLGSNIHSLYSNISIDPMCIAGVKSAECRELLTRAYADAKAHPLNLSSFAQRTYALNEVINMPESAYTHPTIIDWTKSTKVSIPAEGLCSPDIFSPKKSYLMVEMTAPLGLSLISWMARHGARTFVLTSRNGQVDQEWVENISKLGICVKSMAMDVSQKESLSLVYDRISATMPPIGGVAYGAMSLSAEVFEDEAVDDLNIAFDMKIKGSCYLDQLFSKPTLEFFVLFSSLGGVKGIAEQPYQTAATHFMCDLVQNRRAKGLAASIIQMGMVVDVGMCAGQTRRELDHLINQGYSALSERDIHHAFAEAVNASDAKSKDGAEIIIGFSSVMRRCDDQDIPPWCSNPVFSHFTSGKMIHEKQKEPVAANATIKERLTELKCGEEARDLLLSFLSRRLQSVLHLDAESMRSDIPLLDLGCDSLVAVEIGSWLEKEVGVEIPAVDVLYNTAVGVCTDVVALSLGQKLRDHENDQSIQTAASTMTSSDQCLSSRDRVSSATSESSTAACSTSKAEPNLVLNRDFTRVELMSPYQSLIWFAGNYMKDPTQYNVVISYKVEGSFQLERFKRALEETVSRHESLRTSFFMDHVSGELVQGTLGRAWPFFHHVKTSDLEIISEEFKKAALHNWSLEEGETFRATVVSVEPGRHTVIFSYHHIIMDGVSWSTFLREVKAFYEMRPPTFNATQYIDYSVMQNQAIQSGAFSKDIEYWKRRLSPLPDVMPLLGLAKVKYRTATDNYKAHTTTRTIGRELAESVRNSSQRLRGTAFHFFLATLQILFAKLLNIENMCIGMSDANRKHEQYLNTIGYFVNLLPLQSRIVQGDSFASVFQRTSRDVLSALSHSSMPSNLVVDHLDIPRTSTHTPLFQVAINYRVGEITEMSVEEFKLTYERSVMGNAPYDMSFHITPTALGTCILDVTCRDYLYSPEAAGLVLDMYINLLAEFGSNSSRSVQQCALFSSNSDETHLSVRRGTRIRHRWPETLSARFRTILQSYADRTAVIEEKGRYTYSCLGARMCSIANALIEGRITPGTKVAVLCQPSLDSVASLLAILLTGAVYVPLDLSSPMSRHSTIIDASGANVILCSATTLESASTLGVATIINVSAVPEHSDPTIDIDRDGTSPSVLLYTSGSTGKPKGVLLSQVGFINYLAAKAEELHLDHNVTILQQSSVGFDMGLAQILNAIMNGGKLVIVPQAARGDPIEVAKLIRREKVTFTLATPSEYMVILQHGCKYLEDYTSWRHACLGGEPFTDQLKREFVQLGHRCPVVQDSYGVTEISACTTFETMNVSQLEEARSVGKPIPNTSIYILDDNENLVGIGVPGEICIGGAGIALGYLDEEQTRLKFVEDRFASEKDIARGWTRMYRTGDKGRMLEDGSLILLGRMDGNLEIKLRGLRIDLDDVGATLVNCSSGMISAAVVCVKGDGDSKYLVAYVAVAPGRTSTDSDLQRLAISLPLPQYMCPALVVRLDSLPRTANGKVDRKAIEALPALSAKAPSQENRRLTLGEGELKLLWRGILPNKPQIQPESDFFMLGGNSLLLIKLQGAICTSIGVHITLRELYAASTLSSMALKVASRKAETPMATINWYEETAVPEAILQETSSRSEPRRSRESAGIEIILTGAIGFLGRTILRALLHKSEVNKIHCLAVEKGQDDVLPSSSSVGVYYGSLLDSTLGLSTAESDTLQSCVDVIIHAGARGHCLNTYSSLRTPNVRSTHFLAAFARRARIPLHYVSSPRVILQSGQTSLGPISVASHPPLASGSEGFTATKWASEAFLEHLADRTGLSVYIHRPCTPIGDNAPDQDALNSLLHFSDRLSATPRLTNMGGFLDFQKVEIIAERIASEVTSSVSDSTTPSSSSSSSSVHFRHHSGNVRIPVKSFKEYMEKIHGRPFAELGLPEWSAKAMELGMEPLIPAFLEAVAESSETMYFPFLGEECEG